MVKIVDIESDTSDEEEAPAVFDGNAERSKRQVYTRDVIMALGQSRLSNQTMEELQHIVDRFKDVSHLLFRHVLEPADLGCSETGVESSSDVNVLEVLKEAELADQSLEMQIFDIVVNHLSLKDREVEERNEIMSKLESVLKTKFPNCRLHPFGSVAAGFALRNSDLDIYLELGSLHECQTDTEMNWFWYIGKGNAKQNMRSLANLLRREERFRSSQAVFARIPGL